MIWCSFSLDAARKVGSTPSMIQGWRPYSAISQPASIATQGSGRLQNASLRLSDPTFPGGLSLLFSHLKGNLKLEINGIFEDFTRFQTLDDRTIGQVKLSVKPETEFSGRVEFNGKIETFAIGGQELWLDTLCPQ